MSRELVRALEVSTPHLHSPADDLELFYHTALWAAAFNDAASGRKYDGTEIRRFRGWISGDQRFQAIDVVQNRLYESWKQREQEYGPFFVHSMALLCPWLEKLVTLIRDWNLTMDQAEKLDGTKREEYLSYNFWVYGCRGVEEYFELLREHRASLERGV